MGFSPLSLAPPLSTSDVGDGRGNKTGVVLEHEKVWSFECFRGGEGYYGSGKNCRCEDAEGRELHCTRGHWRPAEDAKLIELVALYGPQKWNLIAEKLEGRSGKSCRLRWFNQLDPRINRKAFTEDEEERLLFAHKFYGNKWALLSRLFPGRTDNAVKNHWHVIMARRRRERSDACRRRRPSCSASRPSPHISLNMKETKSINKALSTDSDFAGSRDESLPNFTGLCICSSSSIGSFRLPVFTTHRSDGKLVAGQCWCNERFDDRSSGFLLRGSYCSVSSAPNSEASASESVVKDFSLGVGDEEKRCISLPFIDFLGVGATQGAGLRILKESYRREE